jgi:ankyrin repeat protein
MKPSVGERIYSYARSGDVVGLQTMANDFPEHVNWRHPRNYKQTALWSASKYGRVAAVTFLLKHGADPLLCDESGMSCVEIACIEGKVMVLQELVASNARLALAPRALFFAAQEGRTGVVKILLQHGASPDVMCEGRFSPLMAAACGNHVAVMSLLVAHDVSLESATDEGDAALHLAAKSNKADACRCLLLHGASGSRTNKSGKVDYLMYTIVFVVFVFHRCLLTLRKSARTAVWRFCGIRRVSPDCRCGNNTTSTFVSFILTLLKETFFASFVSFAV